MRNRPITTTAGPTNTHGLTRSSQFPGSRSANLLSSQYSSSAPPTPATIASTALRTLIMDRSLSGGQECATRCRSVHPAPIGLLLLLRPAVVDVLEHGVEVFLTADPVHHSPPEGAVADRARHRVRPVEPE